MGTEKQSTSRTFDDGIELEKERKECIQNRTTFI